jgi:hypothetical protein
MLVAPLLYHKEELAGRYQKTGIGSPYLFRA